MLVFFYFIITVTCRRDCDVKNLALRLCVPAELDRVLDEWDLTSVRVEG